MPVSDNASSTTATALLVTVSLIDVGLDGAERQLVVEITGESADQPCIDCEPRLDGAEDLLRPWQGRKRRAEAGRDALLQELDEPVARGAGNAVIDRGDEHCVDGRLRDVGRTPLLGIADIDLGIKRDHDVVEDDVMAAAGAQAVMIPGLDDAGARQSRRHQELSDARLGLVRPRPDQIPFQDRRPRRIDLVTGQAPAGLGAARDRRRQAAARGRAELGLDAERVDEREALDALTRKLARQPRRPGRAAPHHQMVDVVHRQHQRGRRIGLADDADDARGVSCARPAAAMNGRHRQRQQARLGQLAKILEGKAAGAVVLGCTRSKAFGQRLGACDVVGLAMGGPCRDWLQSHHVASNPSKPRICRRRSARCGSPRWRG